MINSSPLDIASQSIRRTDALTGTSEVLAPQIKSFASKHSSVHGQLQLRTAAPYTDTKGTVHRDGAYLDILLNYATATPNPEEALFFDSVSWPGGDAAELVNIGQSVLDCTEEAREIYRVPINYSGYYPSYRGHGFNGRYGLGSYGGFYGGHYGGSGGYYGGGHYGGGHGGTGVHDHDDNDDSGDSSDTNDDGMDETTDTTDRPRRPRRPYIDVAEPGSDPEYDTTLRPRRRPGTDPAPQPRARPLRSKRVISEVPQTSRPKPAPVSRPRPVSRPASKPAPKPVSRPSRSRSNTSVDRSFRNTNNSRTRSRSNVKSNLNYHPQDRYAQQAYSEYVVSYSCARQETLRVFIPHDRLIASERNGLLLYARPRNGIEETIVLPPNYISGFLLAAYPPGADPAPQQESEPTARTPIIYGDP